jgi:hypothetical protein
MIPTTKPDRLSERVKDRLAIGSFGRPYSALDPSETKACDVTERLLVSFCSDEPELDANDVKNLLADMGKENSSLPRSGT